MRWTGSTRVERHIRRLYDAAKEVDPEGLVTYVNFPTTEYLSLPFLDLLAYNVYLESVRRLGSYIARLHSQAGNRPLIMAELGLDSREHGAERQAALVSRQVRTSVERGCAGSFVFAWTDEWYRGGEDVTDWEFGLTTRDRPPKPALDAVAPAAAEPLASPQVSWPRASVVICVYNGAATLADCLEGATALDYPNYEVIVVDDGSTDDTAQIASTFDVRLIRTENGGLSRARNVGIEAATGEIIAFTDGDARPDADWLTYLALGLRSGEFAAVGGPNIAPPGDGLVAQCVAHAPGGPVYVLNTDQEAEHVPGCNMAFQTSALREIGGFDPRFRTAGDDVDICWRIEERGWRIGFTPSAVVWHHARATVAAYWRQQCGYGAAEALLAAKWPEKYNAAGHVTWGGRIYGPGVYPFPFTRSRIYGGTWGNAPFQSREVTPPGWLWEASAMPEWHLAIVVLAALSACGLLWTPLLVALPLLVLALGTTLARGVVGGARALFTEPAKGRTYSLQRRALTMTLHLLQPLARLVGRFVTGLVPWRARVRSRRFAWPRTKRFSVWREVGEAPEATLERIEKRLADAGAPVQRDDGYHAWDLAVEGGVLGAARLRSCVGVARRNASVGPFCGVSADQPSREGPRGVQHVRLRLGAHRWRNRGRGLARRRGRSRDGPLALGMRDLGGCGDRGGVRRRGSARRFVCPDRAARDDSARGHRPCRDSPAADRLTVRYFPRVLPYLRPHSRAAVFSLVATVVVSLLALLEPWPLKVLFDNVLGQSSAARAARASAGPARRRRARSSCSWWSPVASRSRCSTTPQRPGQLRRTRVSQSMVLDFRSDLFQHAQRLSLAFHDQRRGGMLIYAINFQADAAARLVMAIPPLLQSVAHAGRHVLDHLPRSTARSRPCCR